MNIFNTSIPVLIKSVNIGLVVLLTFSMMQCKNADKDAKDKKETTEQTEKSAREKPKLVYDDKGNIIERHSKAYRRSDESVRSVDNYYYKYDDKNNLVEETKESYTPEGELIYKNVNFYKYDEKNQKIEILFSSFDENDMLQRQAKTKLDYDEFGNTIKEQTYYEDGISPKDVVIRDMDETGDLFSEEYITYNPDGSKKDHKKYYYSDYGLDKTEDLMKKE